MSSLRLPTSGGDARVLTTSSRSTSLAGILSFPSRTNPHSSSVISRMRRGVRFAPPTASAAAFVSVLAVASVAFAASAASAAFFSSANHRESQNPRAEMFLKIRAPVGTAAGSLAMPP